MPETACALCAGQQSGEIELHQDGGEQFGVCRTSRGEHLARSFSRDEL